MMTKTKIVIPFPLTFPGRAKHMDAKKEERKGPIALLDQTGANDEDWRKLIQMRDQSRATIHISENNILEQSKFHHGGADDNDDEQEEIEAKQAGK